MDKKQNKTINYSSAFIYIKKNHDIFKGYWIWDERLSKLKIKFAAELLYHHKTIPQIYEFIYLINRCFTMYQLDKIIKKINEYCFKENNGFEYKLYCNAEDAIKEVKKHNGDVFIDYNKTIEEDCLTEQ